MSSQNRNIDMCNGPLFKKIFIFALPIMAMYILQLLFNTADMVVVGHFSGSKSLAAVASATVISEYISVLLIIMQQFPLPDRTWGQRNMIELIPLQKYVQY